MVEMVVWVKVMKEGMGKGEGQLEEGGLVSSVRGVCLSHGPTKEALK